MTIKELFDNWVQPDVAEYYLACLLGIMEYDESIPDFYPAKVGGVFNTHNKIETMLFKMLEAMVKGGILETQEDGDYRWNKSFKGYWEGGKDGL
jgi:hypothetical protein